MPSATESTGSPAHRLTGSRPHRSPRAAEHRVAITGLGSINALGTGIDAFAAALREGTVGIGALTVFPSAGFRTTLAAEVRNLAPPAAAPRALVHGVARTGLLALTAALEAWRMAGLSDGAEVGVLLGTTTGGMAVGEEAYRSRESSQLRDWLETPI